MIAKTKTKMIPIILAVCLALLGACVEETDPRIPPEIELSELQTPEPAIEPSPDTSPEPEQVTEPRPDTIIIRVSDSQSAGYPTVIGLEYFAMRVLELTDGEIVIEVHAGGILGEEQDVIERVVSGELEMIRCAISQFAHINPDIDALSLPFVFQSREHKFEILDGPIGAEIMESLREGGLLGLSWFDAGARSFYSSVRHTPYPESLAGKNIRIMDIPIMHRLVEILGANPVPLPFGEINSALQAGIIDGAENSILSYEAQGHFFFAPYFTFTEHVFFPEAIVINADLFDSLTAAQQNALRVAAEEAALIQRTEWLRQESWSESIAARQGTVAMRLTDEQRLAFVAAMEPLYDEFAHLEGMIEGIRAPTT